MDMDFVVALAKGLVALVISTVLLIVEPILELIVPRSFRRHDVSGKIALITGGGSGIGRRVAIRLASKGAKVISWDINSKGNDETASLIRKAGGVCNTYTVDLCQKNEIYRSAKLVQQMHGKVDILINNAGLVAGKDFLEIPDELINKVFSVNVFSGMWTCKAFLPAMMKENSGQVVTIASLGGLFGVRRQTEYGASKFAAVGFDEALGQELSHDGFNGISLTVVCPFYINTGMFEGASNALIPILDQDYVADEITDAILMKKRHLILPASLKLAVALKGIFTDRGNQLLRKACGVDMSMQQFLGRKKQ